MIRRRIIGLELVAGMLASVSAACGKGAKVDRELLDILRRSARDSHSFTYIDNSGGNEVNVQGVVVDDFRYKARLTIAGKPVLDEIGSDDAVADRLSDPNGFALLRAPAAAASAAGSSAKPAPDQLSPEATTQRLLAGSWVVDPSGAPSVISAASLKRKLGEDPILDSLTVWDYVEQATQQAFTVKRFNAEAVDYKAKEDPFPKPEKGSGVTRYDLVAPFLPAANGGGANQAVPDPKHFRKMSVYVKDGRVIQVLEKIDVVARLGDLARKYGIKFPAGASDEEKAAFAIKVINEVRVGQGGDPIRVRDMSFAVRDIGKPLTVALPSDAAAGYLSVLRDRGRAARSATATAASSQAQGAQPTTPTTAAGCSLRGAASPRCSPPRSPSWWWRAAAAAVGHSRSCSTGEPGCRPTRA
jgi:hypothetical protein